jgi:hypothetical protein
MFEQIKKLVKDCLTENNGTSYCPFRVAGASLSVLGIPTFVAGGIASIYKTGALDYITFATGFGAMMTGLAVLAGGIALKAKTDT